MNDLKKIKELVMAELQQNPTARKSDPILFLGVCKRKDIDVSQSIKFLLETHAVPSFCSVRRARQKIQAKFPELKDEKTAERRAELEEEYRAFVNA